jgi:ketosteroid isomerase-like protein
MENDTETLTKLNHDYVTSVQSSGVERFDEILADDFVCTNPDGSLLNRAEFLKLIGQPPRISELKEDQVVVRVLGDFAIIHARISYRSKGGVHRYGRYTDDWARRGGRWLCISAHTSGEDF